MVQLIWKTNWNSLETIKLQNGEGNGNPLQYSCLENPMDRGAWSRLQSMGSLRVGDDWVTSISLFTFMHWRRKWQPTCVLAWRIPGMGEPGGLPSMELHRVGHGWSDLAAAAITNSPLHKHTAVPLESPPQATPAALPVHWGKVPSTLAESQFWNSPEDEGTDSE